MLHILCDYTSLLCVFRTLPIKSTFYCFCLNINHGHTARNHQINSNKFVVPITLRHTALVSQSNFTGLNERMGRGEIGVEKGHPNWMAYKTSYTYYVLNESIKWPTGWYSLFCALRAFFLVKLCLKLSWAGQFFLRPSYKINIVKYSLRNCSFEFFSAFAVRA